MHLWLSDTKSAGARLVTMTGGMENEPAISPDGARVALALQQADYDLYQIGLDHLPPSIALATSRNEMDPAWSPTSPEMAYTTDRTGQEEIWLRSQRGDWERALVTPGAFGQSPTYYLDSPAFSPDGLRIAYTRLSSETSQIWMTPVAGGPPVRLSESQQWEESPSWSPDGSWIAYARRKAQQWSLEIMRVGTRSPPVTLTSDMSPLSHVEWAPSGEWIAYNSRQGLAIASTDGKTARVVHEQNWMAFTWSLDSERLYGIRQSDDLRHLTFTSLAVRSGVERVINDDFMPMPLGDQPVRGITRVSSTTFLIAIGNVRSDVWLLEGFDAAPTLWNRLVTAWPSARPR